MHSYPKQHQHCKQYIKEHLLFLITVHYRNKTSFTWKYERAIMQLWDRITVYKNILLHQQSEIFLIQTSADLIHQQMHNCLFLNTSIPPFLRKKKGLRHMPEYSENSKSMNENLHITEILDTSLFHSALFWQSQEILQLVKIIANY